jgi:beta-phosphoglucomutase-like phosphatase (HAD superfamily)
LHAWGVRIVVVSGNWAGLEVHYRELDIERYFEGFVISEMMGCYEPDPRMYAASSDLLGLAPRHCLFIDDDPDLVSAAVDLAYHGVVLMRGAPSPPAVRVVTSLDELLPIVAQMRDSARASADLSRTPPFTAGSRVRESLGARRSGRSSSGAWGQGSVIPRR